MGNLQDQAKAARARAFALRETQNLTAAAAEFAAGAACYPRDPGLAFGLAQTSYELGDPAADLFAQAAALAPGNLDIVRNQALALISEGRADAARQLLEAGLAQQPDWLDGHKALATLNWISGDRSSFSDHLAPAAGRSRTTLLCGSRGFAIWHRRAIGPGPARCSIRPNGTLAPLPPFKFRGC